MNTSTKHMPAIASPELLKSLQEELRWAEHHSGDLTIAKHNREWFSDEVDRLRADLVKLENAK